MEVLRAGGGIGDLKVDVLPVWPYLAGVRQLEEAFQAARAVLRTHAVVAVREQHCESRALHPLGLSARDESIDDYLGAVEKIPKLRLPYDQPVWILDTEAVLKAEHGLFGQRAVDHLEVRLLLLLHRVERDEDVVRLLVHQHRVAVGECGAPHVLPGYPHVESLSEKRSECHRLGRRPVYGGTLLSTPQPGIHVNFLEVWVHVEVLRVLDRLPSDVSQELHVDPRVPACDGGASLLNGGPLPLEVCGLGHEAVDFLQLVVEPLHAVGDYFLQLPFLHHPSVHELGTVRVRYAPAGADLLVQQGIGEGRVVHLVVAPQPEAVHVDEHVLAEAALVLDGEPRGLHDRLGARAVDVQHGRADHPGQVGAVARRAGALAGRGEAHLVVDDQVQGPAHLEVRQSGEGQGFLVDALAGQGGVAVDLEVEHLVAPAAGLGRRVVAVAERLLSGARLAHGHGVDGLEVRRVVQNRDVARAPAAGGQVHGADEVAGDVS